MAIASLLYTISAYRRFHRNHLLAVSEGSLYQEMNVGAHSEKLEASRPHFPGRVKPRQRGEQIPGFPSWPDPVLRRQHEMSHLWLYGPFSWKGRCWGCIWYQFILSSHEMKHLVPGPRECEGSERDSSRILRGEYWMMLSGRGCPRSVPSRRWCRYPEKGTVAMNAKSCKPWSRIRSSWELGESVD